MISLPKQKPGARNFCLQNNSGEVGETLGVISILLLAVI